MRFRGIPLALALAGSTLLAVPVLAQRPADEGFKNLKVLPKDISHDSLDVIMNGFTRALGVRCDHCHVRSNPTGPFKREDFPRDDKLTKEKAREMMKMVRDINGKYLAALEHRAEPPVGVECVTCHRGTTLPRTLQSVLRTAYDTGGLDSTRARYRALRDRYYGRSAYDFGEVSLADVGGTLARSGHPADAESLHAWNVAMNPGSAYAKRQWAATTVANGFRQGAAAGGQAIEIVRAKNGPEAMNEEALNAVAYTLLGTHEMAAAIAAFERNAKDHPQSANAYDSLGEGYAEAGETKKARAAYEKSLKLDPANENARTQLKELKK